MRAQARCKHYRRDVPKIITKDRGLSNEMPTMSERKLASLFCVIGALEARVRSNFDLKGNVAGALMLPKRLEVKIIHLYQKYRPSRVPPMDRYGSYIKMAGRVGMKPRIPILL